MRFLLMLVGMVAFLFCGLVFANSQSSIHEIEALILALIGVTAAGLAIVSEHLVALLKEAQRSGAEASLARKDLRQPAFVQPQQPPR